MNTKPIPVIMTLSASGICCVISILQHVTFGEFLLRLSIVAVVFFVLGMIVGLILLAALGPPDDGKSDPDEADENTADTAVSGDMPLSSDGSPADGEPVDDGSFVAAGEDGESEPDEVENINTEGESDDDFDETPEEDENTIPEDGGGSLDGMTPEDYPESDEFDEA